MRILHVAPYYHPSVGGGELHLKTLSEHLVRRGHQVTVLTQRRTFFSQSVDRTLRNSEIINGVLVRRFTPHLHLSNLIEKIVKLPGGYRILRGLLGTHRLRDFPAYFLPAAVFFAFRARPDLIVVENWAEPGIVWQFALLRRFRRCALIGMPLFHTENRWSHGPVLATLISRYDAMVALTEHERAFIRRQSNGDRPVYVVGAGVDPSAFTEPHGDRIRNRYGLQGRPVVGYIGRLQREKGVARLLAAMEMLWSANDGIRLLLAGEADPEMARLLDDLSPISRSRIVLTGAFREEDKASLLDAVDVFVMPSLAESFGIAYLEAWLCHRPVIGSRTGAVACVIQDGVDGLLVDPEDVSSLATAIQSLLSDEKQRRRFAEAGYKKTLTMFTTDRISDQIENVYLRVVQNHSNTPDHV